MDPGAKSYARYLDGDETGFDELIGLCREPLILFLNGYVRDMHTAEDLAEDAFLELIVKKRAYNFKTPIKTYLFMIGRSKALNFIKRSKRELPLSPEEMEPFMDAAPSCEEIAVQNEKKAALAAALQKLRPEYREALALVYLEGFSRREAAGIMKKSEKQVENLLYRGRAAMKKVMDGEGMRI